MNIQYFTPRYKYKPVSLTGNQCALNCRFCNRKYLENMVHVNPSNFTRVIKELYEYGVRGVLLSGGFNRDGVLPIENYIDELRVVKRELGLITSAHLGLNTNRDLLLELKEVIDVVDYEFSLSSFIVNEIRGFQFKPERYIEALTRMLETGLHVVPHIYVWHPGLDRELLTRETSVLSDLGIEEVTLLVYIDPYVKYEPLKLAGIVLENIEYLRNTYSGKIYLGCMRPGYIKPLLDPVVIEKNLVERVANPHYSVLRKYPSEVFDACCSIPLTDETRRIFKAPGIN